LRAARLTLPHELSRQAGFAATLNRELGVPISPTTLSGWETGRRTVPAAVWLAAALSSNQSLDALLADVGAPNVSTWVDSIGLTGRLDVLMNTIGRLEAELIEVRQHLGLPWHSVTDAELPPGHPLPGTSDAAESGA